MKKVLFLIVIGLINISLFSQSIRYSGYVKDRTGNSPIQDAAIELIDLQSGKREITKSSVTGYWEINYSATKVESEIIPSSIRLEQNYPNPFNPSTKIRFSIGGAGHVKLYIHDILGRELETKSWYLNSGNYTIDWFSKGAAGILFYTIESEGKKITKKMVQLDGGAGGFGALSQMSAPIQLKRLQNNLSDFKIIASKFGYLSDSVTVSQSGPVDFNLITLHNDAFVFDLHNDLLENTEGMSYEWAELHTTKQTDIPRMQEGGVDAEMFVVWIDPDKTGSYYNYGKTFVNTFKNQIGKNSATIMQARNADEIENANKSGKIAAVLCLEGGHVIENSINKLIEFYNDGARYMTITWNNSLDWAVSAADSRSNTVGLSDFGKQIIKTMDSLGMLIDVAHTGVKTIEDILSVTQNPIIDTHAGAYTLRQHTRNLTDSQLKAVANSGGVIGVVFYPSFLVNKGKATVDSVVKHIDYIKNLIGVDYVAIGSDYDGMGSVAPPTGLEDISKLPNLTLALLKKGYSETDIRKILGLNYLRVIKKVCR